jgi:hypothetical protein
MTYILDKSSLNKTNSEFIYKWKDRSDKGLVHRSASIFKEQEKGTEINLYPDLFDISIPGFSLQVKHFLSCVACCIIRRNFLKFESKFFKNDVHDLISIWLLTSQNGRHACALACVSVCLSVMTEAPINGF